MPRHEIYYHGTETHALESIRKTGLQGLRSEATVLAFGEKPPIIFLTTSADTAIGFAGRGLRDKAAMLAGGPLINPTSPDEMEAFMARMQLIQETEKTLRTVLLRTRIPEQCQVEVQQQEREEEWRTLTQCDISPEDIEYCLNPPPPPPREIDFLNVKPRTVLEQREDDQHFENV